MERKSEEFGSTKCLIHTASVFDFVNIFGSTRILLLIPVCMPVSLTEKTSSFNIFIYLYNGTFMYVVEKCLSRYPLPGIVIIINEETTHFC